MRTNGKDALYATLAAYWTDQLAALAQALPAVAAGRDAEGLHRYRVALRRTRSLHKLFRPLLPEGEWDLEVFDQELGWLGSATGAVRDLDVLIQAALMRGQPALQPVLSRLAAQRIEMQRELRRTLRGVRAKRLLQSWQHFVELLPRCEAPPAARVKPKKLFRVQLLQLALWLLRHGSPIDGDTPARELHRLRIRAKRLRYLVELFRDSLPKRRGKELLRALIELQDRLGAHQDAVATGECLQQLRASGELPAESVQALDQWLCELQQTQQQARAELPELLRHFGECCALI